MAKEEFKLHAGHKHLLLSTQLVNDALQGLTTNVCGDYCVFYVFYDLVCLWLRKLGDSIHDRDHCVREICLSFFGAFGDDGVHVSPLVSQTCKASCTVNE